MTIAGHSQARVDYVSVQLGVQRTGILDFQKGAGKAGSNIVEPLNPILRIAFNVRPASSPWNISLGAGNFTLYQYERLYYPILFLGGHYDFSSHMSVLAEVDLKPSGIFNCTTNFNEISVRTGLTYVFYLVTDIHYDGTNDRLERFVAACAGDGGTEKAVLCLGDFNSKKGVQSRIYAKLQPLYDAGWAFLPTIGNHDIFFGEYDKFSKYWPLTTYTFKVNMPGGESDFFICLDTAEGSCGTSQRQWLENQLKAAAGKYRNIYVYTHTNFFNTDNTQITSGNLSLEETYDLMSLFSTYGVSCVLTGHDHYYEHCIFREVSYYTLNALCNEPGSYYKAQFGKVLQLTELTIE